MTNLLLACWDKLTKNMFLLLVSFLLTFSIKGLSETMGVLTMFYNLHGVLRASNKAPGDPCLAPSTCYTGIGLLVSVICYVFFLLPFLFVE